MEEDSAPVKVDKTELAFERTFLAYERTLLAWTRTSISLITFGFTLYKFFQYLTEREPEKHSDHLLGPRTIGAFMIGVGIFMLLLASIEHRKKVMELRKIYPEGKFSQSMLLAFVISILGVLMFISAL